MPTSLFEIPIIKALEKATAPPTRRTSVSHLRTSASLQLTEQMLHHELSARQAGVRMVCHDVLTILRTQ